MPGCREESGGIKEAILRHVNNWVCRAYCHKVVKLSDAVQPLPKQTTEFVHGVAESFLDVGRKKAQAAEGDEARWARRGGGCARWCCARDSALLFLTAARNGLEEAALQTPPSCRLLLPGCRFSKGAYFIGKVVWAKGYTELLELLSKHHKSAEVPVHIDCYGTGEDLPAVSQACTRRPSAAVRSPVNVPVGCRLPAIAVLACCCCRRRCNSYSLTA